MTAALLVSSRFRHTFRALRYRNFRLFIFGQIISLTGSWMQRLAMLWLVYRLTQSPWLLGLIGFCSQIPYFFLAPIAGMASDRFDRHRLLIATQALEMLQALLLAALVLSGRAEIWHLVALSVFLGVVSAFEVPARQAFVIRMVDNPRDLGNAIALNSTTFNITRLVGPSVAGLLVARVGEGNVFLINGLSYVAVLAALFAMRLDPAPQSRAQFGSHFIEGIRYAFGSPPIRVTLLLLAVIGFAGMPYFVLMPMIADRVFGGGADTLGLIMSASGAGALVGAIWLAGRTGTAGINRMILATAVLFSLGLAAVGFVPRLELMLAILFITGMSGILMIAGANTMLQALVSDARRGSVMSYFSMAVLGFTPFGTLLAGAVAERIGAPWTLTLCGLACAAGVLCLARAILSIQIPPSLPLPETPVATDSPEA